MVCFTCIVCQKKKCEQANPYNTSNKPVCEVCQKKISK